MAVISLTDTGGSSAALTGNATIAIPGNATGQAFVVVNNSESAVRMTINGTSSNVEISTFNDDDPIEADAVQAVTFTIQGRSHQLFSVDNTGAGGTHVVVGAGAIQATHGTRVADGDQVWLYNLSRT